MWPTLPERVSRVEATLEDHVKLCERRALLLQKVCFFIAGCMVTALGLLVKIAFHLG